MFDGKKKQEVPQAAWQQALASYLGEAEAMVNRAIGVDDTATLRSIADDLAGIAFLMEDDLREWAQALQLKIAHAIKACTAAA